MSTLTRRKNPKVTKSGKAEGVKQIKEHTNKKSAKKNNNIRSKEAYDLTMQEIEVLMKKGEKNLSEAELSRLRTMAEAAEDYEDNHQPLPLPESLPDIIKMRMFQMKLNQSFTAQLLNISNAKLSLILSGKQKPDIFFIKAVHEKLNVDANLIFQAI